MRIRIFSLVANVLRVGGGASLAMFSALTAPGFGAVVVNEIHYFPDIKTERVEFIELHNTGNAPVVLSGWSFSQGVDFAFPAGTAISPGGFVVVAHDPAAFRTKFGVAALGPWTGKLSNEGERVVLRDASGVVVDEVEYRLGFPWPTVGDPPGYSIELVNPSADNNLGGSWRVSVSSANATARGPTPGVRNAAWLANPPPNVRQVEHAPDEPVSNELVRIMAKVTDPDGVAQVVAQYQLVDPGNYIERTDAAYQTAWTPLSMNDSGRDGDTIANDQIFTVTIPATLQVHRRLVRYRIVATDRAGNVVTAPYGDDPQPNFAYFVYDAVPAWQGAIQPNSSDPIRRERVVYGPEVMRRLPVYHLISKAGSVQQAQYGGYTGDVYRWNGTLIYDGKVYDHIRYRARGGVWRYAMGKNMWKFDFNRGHRFESRDNWGRSYKTSWDKLNLGACIQQGDYLHRGEQGMFESVGFRLFNLAGVEAPHTHFVHFRVIDGATESNSTNQFDGDFWGLYLAVEQPDGRFLDEHNLPDGNFYKMEGNTGDLNNQGPASPSNKSDLNAFLSGYRNATPSDDWWRRNFDLPRYYSYQTVVQGIHHYDICYGKNYFYYVNPETARWSVHPWDLDLTWADNMYDASCGGTDEFRNRVLNRPAFNLEYKNRIRELRDLLFNTDQTFQLIDEYASIIHNPNGGPSFVAADRAMWDYNPIMASSLVNPSKSGQGRFYQIVPTKDFAGMVKKMKDYVVRRGTILDNLAADPQIPATPALTSIGPAGFPGNRLAFRVSNYAGSNPFAALQWRLGEVTPANRPYFDRAQPNRYEVDAVWQSEESTQFKSDAAIPAGFAEAGRTYRVRARFKDSTGRWSHWSAPVEFTAAQADSTAALTDHLRLTELMYDPLGGTDFEFIELFNSSSTLTLDLSGVAFTQGVEFTFSPGTTLAPGEYLVVVKANPAGNYSSFRTRYGLDQTVRIVGPFVGSLANDGERITLKTSPGGADLFDFEYGDGRGWPVAADGAGHSLTPLAGVDTRRATLDYPGNWRASAFIGGSPGRADPVLPRSVQLNEFAAATDVQAGAAGPTSNDWIELFNPTDQPIELNGWFLSDDNADLRRWAIPRMVIPAGGRVVFDEVTGFHNPPATGFGLNAAGEQIFLSHLPGGGADRVVDAVRFKAQEDGKTLGRYPDGGEDWLLMDPSRGAPNRSPNVPPVVINEIMYHPAAAANGAENASLEFIELINTGSTPVSLSNRNGSWRLDGGVSLVFPANTVIRPGAPLVIVNFNPTNTAALNAFRSAYGFSGEPSSILGPYQGALKNSSDRVALEKPQAPGTVGDPPAWAIIDEVIYSDQAPWPADADGIGRSLHRRGLAPAGNAPLNWIAGAPSPGVARSQTGDSDGDGLPDDWERAHGLNPSSGADAVLDSDGDGMNNLNEFASGTDPRDPASVLAVRARLTTVGRVELEFTAVAGRSYVAQYRDALGAGNWQTLADVPVQPSTRTVQVVDAIPFTGPNRFYRVMVR